MGNEFGTTPAAGGGYSGRYTTEAEVEQFAGTLNVDVYGDVNSDEERDAGAVQQSIRTAEGRIDLRAGGPYTFATHTDGDGSAGDVAADVFNQWGYKLATYEVAAKRGFTEQNRDVFTTLRDEVFEEIDRFVADRSLMPGAIPPAATDTEDEFSDVAAPIAVLPTVDRDGRTVSDVPVGGYSWDPNSGYRWG